MLTGLFSSCLKEDFDDCPRPFRLFIQAIDVDLTDITSTGEVERVILFIFNENKQIVKAVELDTDKIKNREPINIQLDYPGQESLYFVAWGNVDESVEFPSTSSVKELADLYVRLKKTASQNRTGGVFVQSPCDLFYGMLSVPIEYGGLEPAKDQTIVISRKTSQVAISAFGLKKWHGGMDGVYTYELRESNDAYDKDGNLSGSMVGYQPSAEMDEAGNLFTPVFQTFPTLGGKSYTLYILYNGEVIFSADKDSSGKPLVPTVGRLLNIILDFRGELSIQVVVTPWNQVFQYVEI